MSSCIRMAAVVNYSPPWWVNLLHRLHHFNLEFQMVSSDFRPEDSEYQKVREDRGNHTVPSTQSWSSSSSWCVSSSSYLLSPVNCKFRNRLAEWLNLRVVASPFCMLEREMVIPESREDLLPLRHCEGQTCEINCSFVSGQLLLGNLQLLSFVTHAGKMSLEQFFNIEWWFFSQSLSQKLQNKM